MRLIARPVVDRQYWILRRDDQKVGNILATGDGYQLTMENKVVNYKTIPMLCRRENIDIEPLPESTPPMPGQVHGYPALGRIYNAIWNVQLRLPLYTRENKSKSWFAAGWYRIRKHRTWQVVQSPKLIALQRYQYQGPFLTKEQANDQSV